jgi:hypothetical protein
MASILTDTPVAVRPADRELRLTQALTRQNRATLALLRAQHELAAADLEVQELCAALTIISQKAMGHEYDPHKFPSSVRALVQEIQGD